MFQVFLLLKKTRNKNYFKRLKRFFNSKKMNNSFNGGLSSHNLFLIILSYIQYLNKNNNKINQNNIKDVNNNQIKISDLNLGKIIFDFLDFFGNFFNFRNYIIDVNSPVIYNLYNGIDSYHQISSLMILDPLTRLNDSKSSYKIDEIQKTFFEDFEF